MQLRLHVGNPREPVRNEDPVDQKNKGNRNSSLPQFSGGVTGTGKLNHWCSMAPEQTGCMNRSVDARSDFYSLGVTLYGMLTDALPFADADRLSYLKERMIRMGGVVPHRC